MVNITTRGQDGYTSGAPTDANTTVGQPTPGAYGCEVQPAGPVQDMFAIDAIAGTFPPQERSAQPADFTGGMGGQGLGGMAEPLYPDGDKGPSTMPHTVYERRGF